MITWSTCSGNPTQVDVCYGNYRVTRGRVSLREEGWDHRRRGWGRVCLREEGWDHRRRGWGSVSEGGGRGP